MKIFRVLLHPFKKNNTYKSLFTSAISEGIKDTFKEMGYKVDKDIKKGRYMALTIGLI
ncbi:MAG: hypothetical protein ACRDE8_17800 [Ginsengibacter sp.]